MKVNIQAIIILFVFFGTLVFLGVNQMVKHSYEEGFEVGALEMALWRKCHDDYMSYGFRIYMWHKKYVPRTCEQIDSLNNEYEKHLEKLK